MSQKLCLESGDIPGLPAGRYKLQIKEAISSVAEAGTENAEQLFDVECNPYTLNPAEIIHCWPAPDSCGDMGEILPFLCFRRSTYPWERRIDPKNPEVPWIALCVLTEGDDVTEKTIPLQEWVTEQKNLRPHTCFQLRSKEEGDQLCTVLEMSGKQAARILPERKALNLTAHVRISENNMERRDASSSEDRFSCVIGSRFPTAAQEETIYTVHLVSLEGMPEEENVSSDIRLLSLYRWKFTNNSANRTFAGLIKELKVKALLKDSTAGNPATALGYLPFAHLLRNGGRTVSWYRGPLLPFASKQAIQPIAEDSDGYLRYDSDNGMLDCSYAAAWQMGKLLACQNRAFQEQLMDWRRNCRAETEKEFHAELLRRQLAGRITGHMEKMLPKDCAIGHFAEEFCRNSLQRGLSGEAKVDTVDPALLSGIELSGEDLKKLLASDMGEGELCAGVLALSKPCSMAAAENGIQQTESDTEAKRIKADRLNRKPEKVSFSWLRPEEYRLARQDFQHKKILQNQPPFTVSREAQESPAWMGWAENLVLLKNVPLWYLLPGKDMTGDSEISFFYVDEAWVRALLDGALSAGRLLTKNCFSDEAIMEEILWKACHKYSSQETRASDSGFCCLTGFFLRSPLASDWPQLGYSAYNAAENGTLLPFLRLEMLTNDLLLGICLGEIKRLEMTQPPAGLVFGLHRTEGMAGEWYQPVRSLDTGLVIADKEVHIRENPDMADGCISFPEAARQFANALGQKEILKPEELAAELLCGTQTGVIYWNKQKK